MADQDAVIRALHIKGFATPDLLAPALLVTEAELAPLTESMSEAGLLSQTAGMWQLTDEGKSRGAELMEADRGAWSTEAAGKALDTFVPLDKKMKQIVTAWQMREVGGQQVLNDHTDQDYDMGVLDDFADLHDYVSSWLRPLSSGLARLSDYAARLDTAAQKADDGEHSYIASPKVDSYHSIWFELHEDLIQLAGRTREEEMEAGRA